MSWWCLTLANNGTIWAGVQFNDTPPTTTKRHILMKRSKSYQDHMDLRISKQSTKQKPIFYICSLKIKYSYVHMDSWRIECTHSREKVHTPTADQRRHKRKTNKWLRLSNEAEKRSGVSALVKSIAAKFTTLKSDKSIRFDFVC